MNQGVKFKAEIIMLHLGRRRHIKQHLGPFANRKLAEVEAASFNQPPRFWYGSDLRFYQVFLLPKPEVS